MKWLRNTAIFAALLLTPVLSLGQTQTVTGSLKSILGVSAVPTKPMVRVTLQNYGGITPKTVNGPIVQLSYDFTPCKIGSTTQCIAADGSMTLSLFANDAIQPVNSYYSLEFFVNGTFQSAINCVITTSGTNYDLNAGTGCFYGTPGVAPPLLPFPTYLGLGGVKAKTCPTGQVFYALGQDGVFLCAPISWGTIIGNVLTQTDLINYITSVIPAGIVDVGITYNGKPTAGLVLVRHPFPVAATIPAGCLHSKLIAKSTTPASGTVVFSIRKNDVEFGTATFAPAGTSATFACTLTPFAENDVLTVIAPTPQDATLANLGGAIYGTR